MGNKNFIADLIPRSDQGWLLNLFNQAVRKNIALTEIIPYIKASVNRYLAHPNVAPDKAKILQDFLEVLDTPEALAYAEYITSYEKLPPQEKAKLKTVKHLHHKQEFLSKQLPTTKQLDYIKLLGYQGQLPINKLEATFLINKLLKEKGQAA